MVFKLKILIVADVSSIHSGRFIDFLGKTQSEIKVFPSSDTNLIDDHLVNHVLYKTRKSAGPLEVSRIHLRRSYLYSTFVHLKSRFRRVVQKLFGNSTKKFDFTDRVKNLVYVLNDWNPDLVISLKLQNEGYLVAESLKSLSTLKRPKWMHFLWGTDIEFFAKNIDFKKTHLDRVEYSISSCDFLMADTNRDVRQANQYGFKGKDFGRMIATGGFSKEEFNLKRITHEDRRIILVKGRDGDLVGRAKFVLSSLEILGHQLDGYQIVVIMATKEVRAEVDRISKLGTLDICCAPRVSYPELLGYFGKSCVSISATTVDGLPLFLAESMFMGAFPIHSNMDSIREWIVDGENGNLFDIKDESKLAKIILNAVLDLEMRYNAEEINRKISEVYFSRDANVEKFSEILTLIEKAI